MHVSYTACNAASKGATVFTLVCGFDFEDHSVNLFFWFDKLAKR